MLILFLYLLLSLLIVFGSFCFVVMVGHALTKYDPTEMEDSCE